MRHAMFTPNFGTFCDPSLVADLAATAEDAGWDGWFLWDHVVHRGNDEQLADPWITLAAVAASTSSIRIGTMVTPLPRRRPWNVARQVATLDHLSDGRVVLGVGIGASRTREFSGFSEEPDPVLRGAMLDEGLEVIRELWRGGEVHHRGEYYRVEGVTFVPRPVQDPVPIWVAAVWPNRRPVMRAARFEGIVPLNLDGPETLTEIIGMLGGRKDIAVVTDGRPFSEWEAAGATWMLHEVRATEPVGGVKQMVHTGPGGS